MGHVEVYYNENRSTHPQKLNVTVRTYVLFNSQGHIQYLPFVGVDPRGVDCLWLDAKHANQ